MVDRLRPVVEVLTPREVPLGSLCGSTSPVATFTPLLGAELVLQPHATVTLDLDASFEHGVLIDQGAATVADGPLNAGELGYLAAGRPTLTLVNAGDEWARLVLLGGEPFDEEILMWWNFVGRTHEEIVELRAAWQAESGRFGRVEGYLGAVPRLPAPVMPPVRIEPRRNR